MKRTIIIFCLISLFAICHGRVFDIDLKEDSRRAALLDTFGYIEGGQFSLRVRDFSLGAVSPNEVPEVPVYRIGFILKPTTSENTALLEQNYLQRCLDDVEVLEEEGITFFLDEPSKWASSDFSYQIPAGGAGFYAIIFFNCEENTLASVKLHLEQSNPGPDFLSVGESPLPTVYFVMSIVFLALLGTWLFYLRKNKENVLKIHHLMSTLLVLKVLSLFFESVRFHYLKKFGQAPGWSVPYYIFAILKGILLFTVILLIGAGWSFVKPFLSLKDKRVFLVVLPLQVVANTAMVIIDETAEGNQNWMAWRDVLRLFDIICCCAILFPIVWSIRSLKEAAETDGKAARNLQRLKQFRSFYVLVVAFIYFTRIVSVLLTATLDFRYLYIGPLITEIVTAVFYGTTGYKFRPIANNPWILLPEDEDEEAGQAESASEQAGDGDEIRIAPGQNVFGLDDEDELVVSGQPGNIPLRNMARAPGTSD